MENFKKLLQALPWTLWPLIFYQAYQWTATDGNKYIMVCTDYFTKWSEAYMHSQIQKHTRASPFCITISLQDLAYQDSYTQTKVETLKANSSMNCVWLLVLLKLHHFTLVLMVKLNAWTAHCFKCLGRPHHSMSIIGQLICQHSCQHTEWLCVTPNEAMLGREVLTPATLIAQPPNESHKHTVFRNTMREAHTCQTVHCFCS